MSYLHERSNEKVESVVMSPVLDSLSSGLCQEMGKQLGSSSSRTERPEW